MELSRRAIVELHQAGAQYYSPRLVGQAHGSLARALMLRPSDEAGALQAYQRALAVDPDYTPDPDRTPPRGRALAQKARHRPVLQHGSIRYLLPDDPGLVERATPAVWLRRPLYVTAPVASG